MTSELFSRIRLCFVAVCGAFVGGQWLGATFDEPLVTLLAMAPALPLFLAVRDSLPAMGVNGLPGIACFLGTLPVTAIGLGLLTAALTSPVGRRVMWIFRGSFAGAAIAAALSMPWGCVGLLAESADSNVPAVPEFFLAFYSAFEPPFFQWPSPWPRMLLGATAGGIAGLPWAERHSIARRLGHQIDSTS